MVNFTNAPVQRGVRIVGAGAYVPSRAIDNERISRAIPGWSPETIQEKTSIRERRYLWDFDAESGVAVARPKSPASPPPTATCAPSPCRRRWTWPGWRAPTWTPSSW